MLFKDFDGKPKTEGGYIIAYASTFDREPDLHGDVIAKGAFTETLKDWQASGKPIPLIFNHSFDDPKYNIGHVVEATQDEHGLLIKAAFDADNETAQYVRKLVQEGRMWKMSFGSIVEEAAWVQLNEGDRREFREIRKAKLIEVSIVQIPANEHAEILEVKSGEGADPEPEIKAAEEERDAITLALMKAAAGFSCSINLQLTDANGNVVSTMPLTATLVDDEGNPLSSLLPEKAEEIEDPQPEEGDSSDPEASESGETGAPEDGDLLSEIQSILGDE